MKSLSTKLFLLLLALTSLVLVATIGLARWSFEYGFTDYINSLEAERLGRIASELSQHYSDNGNSWSAATPTVFDRANRIHSPREGNRPPPPNHGERGRPPRRHEGGPPGDRPPRKGPRHRRSAPAKPTALFDVQGEQIGGPELLESDLVTVPVQVNGTVVGELRTVARRDFKGPSEKAFSRQQLWASALIAVLCLLLATMASWYLARALLRPVNRVKTGLTTLVAGDYSQRLSEPEADPSKQDELVRLMANVDQLAATLEQNRLSRKRWLADISHELRTPVTVLSGELEALMDGLRPLNLQQIESLQHEIDRLKHLINDLYELSLSDIGGLRYQFHHLNISDLLEATLAHHRARIEQAGLLLDSNIEPAAFVRGDPNRLEQLFGNLVSNSIAYTDQPGRISVKLRLQDAEVLIRFADSAPGVPAENLSQLFEPLYREDKSRSRRLAGAGLGLTICRNIIAAHGGEMSAELSQLGGLQVSIRLPLKENH
ncbi:MAG: ATP-binding protein [Pseudomonadota bacterium]